MALPPGVHTVELTIGSGIDFLGDAVSISGVVTPSQNLVHTASGISVTAYPFEFEDTTIEGVRAITVPAVDQGGFQDPGSSLPISWWSYGVVITYRDEDGKEKTRAVRVQPLQDQDSIDLDLLPSVEGVAPPVIGTVAPVTSVNGQVGAVTITGGGDSGPVEAADITDSTAVGRAVLTAASKAAGRSAIDAGTSDLVAGFEAGQAKPGDWLPDIDEVEGLVDAIAEVAAADLNSPTSQALGRISGRRFTTAFNTNAITVWGMRPIVYWDPANDVWPATRVVPAGYTGPVIWNSETDPSATDPPAALDNDLWDKAS